MKIGNLLSILLENLNLNLKTKSKGVENLNVKWRMRRAKREKMESNKKLPNPKALRSEMKSQRKILWERRIMRVNDIPFEEEVEN